jgi:phenylalanyl-tRNA synthetase alpha chain
MRLPEEQVLLLKTLGDLSKGERVDRLAERLGIDQARVAAAAVHLKEQGLVRIEEEPYQVLAIRPDGSRWAKEGFPERQLLRALIEAGGSFTMADAPGKTGLSTKEIGSSLRWFTSRGWGKKEGARLEALLDAEPDPETDETLLAELDRRERASADELRAAGHDLDAALKLLKGRGSWCELREKVHRHLHLEEGGRELLESGLEVLVEVNQLTPELIATGKWREVKLRPYDVQLATDPIHPGKRHPFRRILDETRRVYLEMGFQEIVSPLVESAFWTFDALFQPQDHPAREMQDTFYMGEPAEVPLPDDRDLIDRVRRVHEDGGDTGSVGWQYRWDEATARKAILRTHTTATTVRALTADAITPRRVFSIGHVFRRESVDYKHLPVFYQVDGIVIDPDASFANLLGTLAAFYRKMGFEQFQFRPGFFPYTEPSVEVFIWYEKRKDWVEMGGAGVFRPEVTEPLGCSSPVLAWGLGLERIAMLRYDLSDIRDLYLPDTEWLKGVPLCR